MCRSSSGCGAAGFRLRRALLEAAGRLSAGAVARHAGASTKRTNAAANTTQMPSAREVEELRQREQDDEHDDRQERGPPEPPREPHAGTSSDARKLVAHRDERVHRVVPHRRLRLMVAEPSPFEEIGQLADGVGARVEA